MQIEIQQKLLNNPQMREFLQQNSAWYKYLNRHPNNYQDFANAMQEKYKTRTTDKISSLMENIDMISNVLNILK